MHADRPEHQEARLRALDDANRAYHADDAPALSDAAYDALADRAGGARGDLPEPAAHLAKVPHRFPLRSLDNAFTQAQTEAFFARHDCPGPFVSTPKIDGLALSLVYHRGELARAVTRGDGETGEDVTANVRHVPGIPATVPWTDPEPETIEIRGEVCIANADWPAFQAATQASRGEQAAHPRNAAAGALRRKTPDPERLRHLTFLGYGMPAADAAARSCTRYRDVLALIRILGLRTVTEAATGRVPGEAATRAALDAAARDHPCDGIVIQLDDLGAQTRLGNTRRAPRYALARKFPAAAVETTLRSVTVDVGRTGALTPVAELEPVTVDGVTVSRATLHHPLNGEDLDLTPGDRVLIERAGGVIPALLGHAPGGRPADRGAVPAPWALPATCPCGRDAPVRRDGPYAFCDAPECEPRTLDLLVHGCRRDALDIPGLSQAKMRQLRDLFGIRRIHELFEHCAGDRPSARLAAAPGWGERSAGVLHATLAAKRRQPVHRWLYALGIPDVGRTVSRLVADHAGSAAGVLALADDPAPLSAIDGIGPVITRAFTEALATGGSRRADAEALMAVLTLENPMDQTPAAGSAGNRPLAGHTVVVTGTLENYTRHGIGAEIEARGGAVGRSVSGNTTLVLCGASPGSKRAKAEDRGIRIIDEETFETEFAAG